MYHLDGEKRDTTMATPPERNDLLTVVEHRQSRRTYRFVLRPRGWLPQALGLVMACALLALTFVFSLLVFSLLAGVALVMLVLLWWGRIRKRRR